MNRFLIARTFRIFIFLLIFLALAFITPVLALEIDERDAGEYPLVPDPFGFSALDSFYQDTQIARVKLGANVFTTEDILNNSSPFKAAFQAREKASGLEGIMVELADGQQYSFFDYLELTQKEVKSTIISQDTLWSQEQSPYYIKGQLRVLQGATLTIEAGVEVLFEDTLADSKSGILVDGTLLIEGSTGAPVLLKPAVESAPKGQWQGIYISERGAATINHAVIDRTGAWTQAALYSLGNLQLRNSTISNSINGIISFSDTVIENCEISGHDGYGMDIYVNHKAVNLTIANNQFSANTSLGRLVLRSGHVSDFQVENNTAINNGNNGVFLYGNITGSMTLPKLGQEIPYIIPNRFTPWDEQDTLLVEKGTQLILDRAVIKLAREEIKSSKANLTIKGELKLLGTPSEPVYLTSINDDTIAGDTTGNGENPPAQGDWEGIIVSDTGSISGNYAHLKYGGYRLLGMIQAQGRVTLDNSLIYQGLRGIYTTTDLQIQNTGFEDLKEYAFNTVAANKDISLNIENNSFKNIGGYLGRLQFTNGGSSNFQLVNNQSIANKYSGVELLGNLNVSTTLTPIGNNIPYVVPNTSFVGKKNADLLVEAGKTLTLAPGVIIKLDSQNTFDSPTNIKVKGLLIAQGAEQSKIIFTSLKDDRFAGDTNGDGATSTPLAGDWGSIALEGSPEASPHLLANVTVAYGNNALQVNGKLALDSSTLENNLTNGVLLEPGFSADITNVTFKDNKGFPLYAKFNGLNERLAPENNTTEGNNINGFGITGLINHDFELVNPGENVPYVVDQSLINGKDTTLRVPPGGVIKFLEDAQLNIRGTLRAEGTQANKIYFTSYKNDTVGGDTNNDLAATQAAVADWRGLTYQGGSQGFFLHARSDYDDLHLDLEHIQHLRAIHKATDGVAAANEKAVYIKPTDNGSALVLYDQALDQEQIIADNSAKKTSPMLAGGYLAWLEEDTKVRLYNSSTGATTTFVEENPAQITNFFLNEGYLTWSTGNSLKWQAIGGSEPSQLASQVDPSFRPVISSEYLFYKNSSDKLIHRVDLSSEEEYLMLSNREQQAQMDIYGDNIVFLAKDLSDVVNYVVVGELTTWAAQDLSSLPYLDRSHPVIYKDKVMFTQGNAKRKQLVITPSDGQGALLANQSSLAAGYNFRANDLADNSAIFTDEQLIYVLKTNIASQSNQFISGPLDTEGYSREMDFGQSLGTSIGAEVGEDIGIIEATAGIKLKYSEESKLNLGFDKTPYHNVESVKVGRERMQELGLEGELKVGLAPSLTNIASATATAALSGLYKGLDSYSFAHSDPDTYQKAGALVGAGFVGLDVGKLDFSIDGLLRNVVVLMLNELIDPEGSSESYRKGAGAGVKLTGDTALSILYSEFSAEGLAEIGVKYDGENTFNYYAKESMYKSEFGEKLKVGWDSNLDISIGNDDLTVGTKSVKGKLPGIFIDNSENKLFYRAEYQQGRNKLIITFSTFVPNENGFTKSYSYTFEGSDLTRALNRLQSLAELTESDFTWSIFIPICDELDAIIELLEEADNVKYEIKLTKELSEQELELKYKTDDFPTHIVKPNVGFTVGGTYDDKIELIVDRGTIVKGKVQDTGRVAFIPQTESSMWETLGYLFANLINAMNVNQAEFSDGKASYFKGDQLLADLEETSSNELAKAIFVEIPLDYSSQTEERLLPNAHQYLINDAVYFKLTDINKEDRLTCPAGTKLTLYLNDKWDANYQHYAIFQYDETTKEWYRLGGKLNQADQSISVEIQTSGQYTVGRDTLEPKITWSIPDNQIIANGTNITATITDTDNFSQNDIKLYLAGEQITNWTYNSNNNTVTIPIDDLDPGTSCELRLEYLDTFENEVADSISFTVEE